MNIEQIFEKPLKRNINGVVKAEQTDDASAYIELDEYVITRELENHLRHFFESYVPATGPERIRMETRSAYGFQASSVQVNRTLLRFFLIFYLTAKLHITVRNVMLTPSLKIKSKMHYSLPILTKRCITRLKSFCSILIRVPT